jgi:hypothetical protein
MWVIDDPTGIRWNFRFFRLVHLSDPERVIWLRSDPIDETTPIGRWAVHRRLLNLLGWPFNSCSVSLEAL